MLINWIIKKLFGDPNERRLKKLWPVVHKVNELAESYKSLSDDALKQKTQEFKERIAGGETTDELLPEAYAVVKEACRRLCGTTVEVTGHSIVWNMIPFDVQILGGVALHQRNIAEMATGEGKTLVAVMPLYLNALTGRNVQLVTVNDYLARRDSQWMGHVLKWLGLTVGCIQNEMRPAERRAQYACDVTYGTNSEFGFDYLRDMGMAMSKEELVQRDYFFVIVDEIDSILIDEARTPLIIAGPSKVSVHQYDKYKPVIASLYARQMKLMDEMVANAKKVLDNPDSSEEEQEDAYLDLAKVQMGMPKHKGLLQMMEQASVRKALDRKEMEMHNENNRGFLQQCQETMYFSIDERSQEANLSEKGRNFISPNDKDAFVVPDLPRQLSAIDGDTTLSETEKIEKRRACQAAFDEKSEILHNISQLLRAYCLFEKEVQYIVQDNKVIIVDEFTGRPQPGRRYSDGLHQALEAKENVKIERETQTLASITIQNYFRMYEKLAGMTGTAETEAQEFKAIYNLDVVVIPPNRPCQRVDDDDRIYKTERAKFRAIINEIKECHRRGQPVLVGTISVEVSEILSRMLTQEKIIHNVLNAKHHEQEAEIVARAGQYGQVTIATNMAGRGTDIKLGEGVKEVGGLRVIGSERHDSRRIDRQLRGRCARQGDPGSSRFYISLEDNLMRMFAADRVASLMDKFGMTEEDELSHPLLNYTVENSQKKVEQQHFAIRKRTLEYDDVMNRQRSTIYGLRKDILLTDDPRNLLMDHLYTAIYSHANAAFSKWTKDAPLNLTELTDWVNRTFPVSFPEELFAVDATARDVQAREAQKEALAKRIVEHIENIYTQNVEGLPPDAVKWFEHFIMLDGIDKLYQDHLYAMDSLRQSVSLRSYGQRDPLVEYKAEAYRLFEALMGNVEDAICRNTFRIRLHVASSEPTEKPEGEAEKPAEAEPAVKPKLPPRKMQYVTNDTSGLEDLVGGQGGAIRPKQGPTPIRRDQPKIGRNDPCPCGSGKKYKNCCGRF